MEIQPPLLVGVPEAGTKSHEVPDDPVQAHLGNVLGAEEVGFDHAALAAGIHLRVPVGDLFPGQLELQVHAGNDGHQDDHGDPPAHKQKGSHGQDHGDQLGKDRGDPVQDPGIGIGEPLGAVVQVHRLLVVIAPEIEGQEPLVHEVPHNGPHSEAHELLDVAVHTAEGTPEQTQRGGDDDVDDRPLALGGVAGVRGRQGRGGQGGKVGGDQGQQRRDQRADHLHHDGGRRGPEADPQNLRHSPRVRPHGKPPLRVPFWVQFGGMAWLGHASSLVLRNRPGGRVSTSHRTGIQGDQSMHCSPQSEAFPVAPRKRPTGGCRPRAGDRATDPR
ncbi:hypothetical protein D9M72_385300 [compost metagenome]